jgi:hypothetical protein
MTKFLATVSIFCWVLLLGLTQEVRAQTPAAFSNDEAACAAMLRTPNLTLTHAVLVPSLGDIPSYCYIQGSISGRIRFHMQLPLPPAWNGRLVNMGDGGKDGDLDFADHRLAQGYAVANSNTGHDVGTHPGASFGSENMASIIDFGYRAIHLTANASKAVVREYYRRQAEYAYFEGCSTGGRQGLMEAQRYPSDFDGIVSEAPVYDYQTLNATHVWMAQQVFKDDFAANLAFDTDGDGVPESLTKLEILENTVIDRCDASDGINDGLVSNPLSCDFNPDRDLAEWMCPAGTNADDCFTPRQLQTLKDFYHGPVDGNGVHVWPGLELGSEYGWGRNVYAHEGNDMTPFRLIYGLDHVNYLFYEESPGVPMPVRNDTSQVPDKTATPPEFAWWEFNIDDLAAGKADFMMSLTDAKDPDLTRFLEREDGKLLLIHGWGDSEVQLQPTLNYYKSVVSATYGGNLDAARESIRLFMVPGMGHCGGGPGLEEFDRLAPLVDWVENGNAPDYIVGQHRTNGIIDNQRRICPYPELSTYVGPAGGQDVPANWVERNFACR